MNFEVINFILQSKRPLVFAGNGIKSSGLTSELSDFCEKFKIPCLLTSHAMGTLPYDFPWLMGVYGLASRAEVTSRFLAYNPDVLIVLGTKLGEVSTRGWSPILSEVPFKIHIDKNPAVFKQTYQTDLEIELDLKDFFSIFKNLTSAQSENLIFEKCKTDHPRIQVTHSRSKDLLHPGTAVQLLNEITLTNTLFFSDIGACMAWCLKELEIKTGQNFYVPIGLGAMGSGVAGSIGAKLANEKRPVVCLTGDASFLMHGNEIFTLSQIRKNVIYFVFNDGGHGLVYHGMKTLGFNPGGVRFNPQPDLIQFAESLGGIGLSVSSAEELLSLNLATLSQHPGAVVIDMKIDPSIEAPIMERNRILGFDENKRKQL